MCRFGAFASYASRIVSLNASSDSKGPRDHELDSSPYSINGRGGHLMWKLSKIWPSVDRPNVGFASDLAKLVHVRFEMIGDIALGQAIA